MKKINPLNTVELRNMIEQRGKDLDKMVRVKRETGEYPKDIRVKFGYKKLRGIQ
jgi:hypothetical protein